MKELEQKVSEIGKFKLVLIYENFQTQVLTL